MSLFIWYLTIAEVELPDWVAWLDIMLNYKIVNALYLMCPKIMF